MKNKFLSFAAVSLLAMAGCRNDGDDAQIIDQVVHIYFQNAEGEDLLSKDAKPGFREVHLKDLGGIRDLVSLGNAKIARDDAGKYFAEYIAGAKRNLTDSLNPEQKFYRSEMLLELKKDSATDITRDTMVVLYEWTPRKFSVKSISYNKKCVFKKSGAEPNAFTIIK